MMHVIINSERRKPPRDTAISINCDVATQTGTDSNGMPTYSVQANPEQLHTLGVDVGYSTTVIDKDGTETKLFTQDFTSDHILYAAEWDQVSPYVIVHKGRLADIKMAFAGWPTLTKDEWDEQQAQITP